MGPRHPWIVAGRIWYAPRRVETKARIDLSIGAGRKVQTVKNLEKLWDGLGSVPEGEEQFSALDTILLDDSALKAHMQPYNHLILPEYDAETRRADLAVISDNNIPIEGTKSVLSIDDKERPCIDRTLLGVIGVLDELALQDSVCGWIRADGLWAGFKPIDEKAESEANDAAQRRTTNGGNELLSPKQAAVDANYNQVAEGHDGISSQVTLVESEEPVSISRSKSPSAIDDVHASTNQDVDEASTKSSAILSHSAKRKRSKMVCTFQNGLLDDCTEITRGVEERKRCDGCARSIPARKTMVSRATMP